MFFTLMRFQKLLTTTRIVECFAFLFVNNGSQNSTFYQNNTELTLWKSYWKDIFNSHANKAVFCGIKNYEYSYKEKSKKYLSKQSLTDYILKI